MNWTEILLAIITCVVAPSIILMVKEGLSWLKSKQSNDTVTSVINTAQITIEAIVGEVQQIFVDAVKGTDDWNSETMKAAFDSAKAKTLIILGEGAIKTLSTVFPDVEAWLTAQIESAVRKQK